MFFSILSLLVAMVFMPCAILLQRARTRSGEQLDRLLVEVSRELNVPQQLDRDELYRQRGLLYVNKKSLERQMSYALDDRTRKAYRSAIDQNARSILAVEARLPRVELLRKQMVVHRVLMVLCAVMIGFVSWVYLLHKDAWG